ncbi:TPA: helix-turn-helix transcriptional regulator [Yersinia enterocolitica]|uniref:XRE family transcriptional regulator n=1 Tax=Yersinia massiliensis TaxID=419257 RepID=A0ABM6UZZ9_9GAMM|nr:MULTISPECIES: helix-turn-helix transcriptional regulator [Yersinia]AVX40618.1 XRE family transcriptional regulator [Yersinia massiliensis]MBS0057764.1 helix-turn-helix transcriptional regulator [Yersinia sp. Marseille-Q3913]MCB5310546.1 helix-turn-helix transcriptional regulator [Yersinia massiliensis]
MTGYDLRLWRSGQFWARDEVRSIRIGSRWRQEDAAEQLGVTLRTYRTYEQYTPPLMVELGVQILSLQTMLSELARLPFEQAINRLRTLTVCPKQELGVMPTYQVVMPSLGLKQWRSALNWTQVQVAEKLGVTIRTYKSYEQESYKLPRRVMLAIQALTLLVMLPQLANGQPDDLLPQLRLLLQTDGA